MQSKTAFISEKGGDRTVRGKDLLDKISLADDKYVEEASVYKKSSRGRILRLSAIAAVAALFVMIPVIFIIIANTGSDHGIPVPPDTTDTRPVISETETDVLTTPEDDTAYNGNEPVSDIQTTPEEDTAEGIDTVTQTETDVLITHIRSSYDWPYYRTEKELKNAATSIYKGVITDIYFEVIDIKTGETVSTAPEEYKSSYMLNTIYEVKVIKNYKNADTEKKYFSITGGKEGYKEDEQVRVLRSLNLYNEETGIIIYDLDIPGLNIGETYTFYTDHLYLVDRVGR